METCFPWDHEVGNILSYRSRNTSDISSHIVDFDEQTVGSKGDSYVSLIQETFSSNTAEESMDFGFSQNSSFGENVDFYGIEIGFEIAAGVRYGEGEIITQTVSVANSLEMRVDLGHLKTEYGTSATYQVQFNASGLASGLYFYQFIVEPVNDKANSFMQTRKVVFMK